MIPAFSNSDDLKFHWHILHENSLVDNSRIINLMDRKNPTQIADKIWRKVRDSSNIFT